MRLILESTADTLTLADGRRIRVWKGATGRGTKALAFLIGVCIDESEEVPESDTFANEPFDVPPEVDAYLEEETE